MNTNEIARVAALVGEPARAAMLLALMDGRALTAMELAQAASIGAPTASRHLALMVEGGLLIVAQQGRHRYHRLASAQVAKLLEGIMQIAAHQPPRTGPRDEVMRTARLCYDHIAGRLGLAITEQLLEEGAIEFDDASGSGQVTPRAEAVLQRWGLTLDLSSAAGKRPFCRPCLDWSERRPHLAGRLGALLCAHCLDEGWLTRKAGARALAITPAGAARLRDLLGLEAWQRVSMGTLK